MNTDDNLKKLFEKTDLSYPNLEVEEVVIAQLKRQQIFKARIKHYYLIGYIGLGCCIGLSLIFLFLISNSAEMSADTISSSILLPSFILILLCIQIELATRKKTLLSTS